MMTVAFYRRVAQNNMPTLAWVSIAFYLLSSHRMSLNPLASLSFLLYRMVWRNNGSLIREQSPSALKRIWQLYVTFWRVSVALVFAVFSSSTGMVAIPLRQVWSKNGWWITQIVRWNGTIGGMRPKLGNKFKQLILRVLMHRGWKIFRGHA